MEKKDNNLYPPIMAFFGRFMLSNFFWIFPCMWFIENKNIKHKQKQRTKAFSPFSMESKHKNIKQ